MKLKLHKPGTFLCNQFLSCKARWCGHNTPHKWNHTCDTTQCATGKGANTELVACKCVKLKGENNV